MALKDIYKALGQQETNLNVLEDNYLTLEDIFTHETN